MKLIIFGATGGTGQHLIQQALTKGHEVTAFVRDPSKLNIPGVTVFKGDVMAYSDVEVAVAGHNAVLSALGSPANKIGTIRSGGTLHIIRAMEKSGVRRFVCQTSLGYGDSKATLNRTPFYFKYLIVPFILKKGFADHALQEEYIRQSRLDWVIVRPGNLTDDDYTGKYRHGFSASDDKIKVKVSRADVADFMLKQLSDNTYLHKTPGVSY
jgi:putative NADH-flavin reductase